MTSEPLCEILCSNYAPKLASRNLKEIIPLCDEVNIFYNDSNEDVMHMVTVVNGEVTYKSALFHSSFLM